MHNILFAFQVSEKVQFVKIGKRQIHEHNNIIFMYIEHPCKFVLQCFQLGKRLGIGKKICHASFLLLRLRDKTFFIYWKLRIIFPFHLDSWMRHYIFPDILWEIQYPSREFFWIKLEKNNVRGIIAIQILINDDRNVPDIINLSSSKSFLWFRHGYIHTSYGVNIYHFDNLSPKQQEDFLNYPLDVTYCVGDEDARIAWFKRINQENAILVPQELRNATYVGEWLECAKKFFSATTAQAKKQINDKDDKYCANNYSTGRSIERSEFLELALDWIAYDKYSELRDKKHEDERINRYMADHQHDTDANEIISHYKNVIDWIWDVFFHDGEPKSWQSVRSQDWGRLYAEYKDMPLTEEQKMHISKRTKEIVGYGASVYQKTDGIYEWVLRGEREDEINTYLHLRGFSPEDKSAMYNAQGGIDPVDGKHYEMNEMHAHHIKSWRSGGDSKYDNLVWLSEETHRKLHAGDLDITAEELRKRRDELCRKNA